MAGNGWKLLEMAGNDCKWLKMAGLDMHGLKWMLMAVTSFNGMK